MNKKVGGHSTGWNHRQTYVRIYDPRGFEFEISVPNLLYILENTNSIKGKGLEGEFVYGWDGSDLVLIPTSSPDYAELSQYNKILHAKNYIKAKELTLGATYKSKDNAEWVYLGRFDYHTTKWNKPENYYESGYYTDINKGKHYFFGKKSIDYREKSYLQLLTLKSLGDKFIAVVSSECTEDYAAMIEQLESKTEYSPYDKSKDEYVQYTLESFKNKIKDGCYWERTVYLEPSENGTASIKKSDSGDIYKVVIQERVKQTGYGYWNNRGYYNQEKTIFEGTIEEIHSLLKPMFRNKYLANGKLYQRGE